MLTKLAERIWENKTPAENQLGKWISVEIECIMPSERAENSFVQWARKEGLIKFLTFKEDGSIRAYSDDDIEHDHRCIEDPDDYCQCCDGECECAGGSAFGREIIVTFLWNDWSIIRAVCKKLNEIGCTVNASCGLHVHFDCRHLDRAMVETIGHRVARTVRALKLILPKSRQKNQYCEFTVNDINETEDTISRYAFVNMLSYHRHNTLEIRGHSGTTDANKIINWICILRKIMRSNNTTEIRSVRRLVNTFKFRRDIHNYILERAEKFKNAGTMNNRDVELDNTNAA